MAIAPDDIRLIRDNLGLTQAEFADRLNLSREAVSQWETGRCGPSGAAEILIRQMKALAESKAVPIAQARNFPNST